VCTRNRLAATIELVAEVIRRGARLRYRISNTSSVELIGGLEYRLERENSDSWVRTNPGVPFAAVGFPLLPGESRELSATTPADGPAGSYRISAWPNGVPPIGGHVRVSVRFEVRDRSDDDSA
jgi:hypothetical protein